MQSDIAKTRFEKHKQRAQERMGTPGSKEIKNWLGGLKERPCPIYMQATYPDTITLFNCSEPSLEVRVQCALFSGDGTLTIRRSLRTQS